MYHMTSIKLLPSVLRIEKPRKLMRWLSESGFDSIGMIPRSCLPVEQDEKIPWSQRWTESQKKVLRGINENLEAIAAGANGVEIKPLAVFLLYANAIWEKNPGGLNRQIEENLED